MEQKPDTIIRHKFPCDKLYIELILEYIASYCDRIGTTANITDSILLAVKEALTNIRNHAYKNKKNQPVQLSLMQYKEKIVIELIDYGKPFLKNVTTRSPIEEIASSGLGIYVMEQSMDSVLFTSGESRGTTLTLVKYLTKRKPGRGKRT